MTLITLPDGSLVAPHAVTRVQATAGHTNPRTGQVTPPQLLVETRHGLTRIDAANYDAAVAMRDVVRLDIVTAAQAAELKGWRPPLATVADRMRAGVRAMDAAGGAANDPMRLVTNGNEARLAAIPDPHPDPAVESQLKILRRTARDLGMAGAVREARDAFRQSLRVGCALGRQPYPHDDDPSGSRARTADTDTYTDPADLAARPAPPCGAAGADVNYSTARGRSPDGTSSAAGAP